MVENSLELLTQQLKDAIDNQDIQKMTKLTIMTENHRQLSEAILKSDFVQYANQLVDPKSALFAPPR